MDNESKPDQRDAAFTIPSSIEVPLKLPLKKTASDETLKVLSFRPPTVGEMKQITKTAETKGDAEGGIFMLSLLSNDKLVGPDIERLNFLDMQICVEQLQPFLELAPLSKKD